MNLSERIRDFIKAQGTCTTGEVLAGLQLTPKEALGARQSIGCMAKAGILTQDKSAWPYRYAVARDVADRAARTAQLAPGRDRYNAEQSRKAQERRAQLRATQVAQKAERLAQARTDRLKRAAAIRRMNDAQVVCIAAMKAPKVEHIRTETLEEFRARGGSYEVLGNGVVSEGNRLKGKYA